VHAIKPLTVGQLAWRPVEGMRSVGGVASHIILGRVSWCQMMEAPGSMDLAKRAEVFDSVEVNIGDADVLVDWLQASWRVIANMLAQWKPADLMKAYPLPYEGINYSVSRQWMLWRILAHDLHHGGELAVMLGMQGIPIPELGDKGGHLNVPPIADSTGGNESLDFI